MIAKCIVILAVVAQIRASNCGCGQSILLPSSDPNSQSSSIVLIPSGNSGPSFGGSGAFSRNIVAKGRYPVALSSCGPNPDQQISITASRITAPVQERPIVRLPANIPEPRTVAHSCTCYKTILRPRVHDQHITIPSVQRYVETNHKPLIENIHYEAIPVNHDRPQFSSNSGVQLLEVGSSSSSGSVKLVPFSSQCSCGCQSAQVSQSVGVPRVQVVEAVPQIQTFLVPPTVSFGCSSQC